MGRCRRSSVSILPLSMRSILFSLLNFLKIDAIQRADVEAKIEMNGAAFKCGCFINMWEFWHACRVFKYLHEYLRGNAGKPSCKIFTWIFVASDVLVHPSPCMTADEHHVGQIFVLSLLLPSINIRFSLSQACYLAEMD